MHALMEGMFWGGLLMATPPILVGLAIVRLLLHAGRTDPDAETRKR